MRSFQISDREAGQRMDKYLFRLLDQAPSGFIYKMLRKKNIVLNGKKAAGQEILKAGDEIRLYLSEETFAKFAPGFFSGTEAKNAEIDIVYEDDDILIINKPAGLLSQKAKPGDDCANDRIIAYLLKSGQITPEELRTFHPSICNRLDRNTSGLLIAGKTMRGLQETAALLNSRSLKKYYRTLVAGEVEKEDHLSGYLRKDEKTNQVCVSKDGPGDPIETAWRPICTYGNATLLEVELITGKPHQIRAHLSAIGHPILGDPKYGDKSFNDSLRAATGIKGQLLCSCRMEFPDGRVVKIDEPGSFARAEEWLSQCA